MYPANLRSNVKEHISNDQGTQTDKRSTGSLGLHGNKSESYSNNPLTLPVPLIVIGNNSTPNSNTGETAIPFAELKVQSFYHLLKLSDSISLGKKSISQDTLSQRIQDTDANSCGYYITTIKQHFTDYQSDCQNIKVSTVSNKQETDMKPKSDSEENSTEKVIYKLCDPEMLQNESKNNKTGDRICMEVTDPEVCSSMEIKGDDCEDEEVPLSPPKPEKKTKVTDAKNCGYNTKTIEPHFTVNQSDCQNTKLSTVSNEQEADMKPKSDSDDKSTEKVIFKLCDPERIQSRSKNNRIPPQTGDRICIEVTDPEVCSSMQGDDCEDEELPLCPPEKPEKKPKVTDAKNCGLNTKPIKPYFTDYQSDCQNIKVSTVSNEQEGDTKPKSDSDENSTEKLVFKLCDPETVQNESKNNETGDRICMEVTDPEVCSAMGINVDDCEDESTVNNKQEGNMKSESDSDDNSTEKVIFKLCDPETVQDESKNNETGDRICMEVTNPEVCSAMGFKVDDCEDEEVPLCPPEKPEKKTKVCNQDKEDEEKIKKDKCKKKEVPKNTCDEEEKKDKSNKTKVCNQDKEGVEKKKDKCKKKDVAKNTCDEEEKKNKCKKTKVCNQDKEGDEKKKDKCKKKEDAKNTCDEEEKIKLKQKLEECEQKQKEILEKIESDPNKREAEENESHEDKVLKQMKEACAQKKIQELAEQAEKQRILEEGRSKKVEAEREQERLRQLEECDRMKREEEERLKRVEACVQKKVEAELKKQQEEMERKQKAEEEKLKIEEECAKKIKEELERKKKAELEEKKRQEEENKRKQEEAMKLKIECEKKRKEEEERIKKIRQECERQLCEQEEKFKEVEELAKRCRDERIRREREEFEQDLRAQKEISDLASQCNEFEEEEQQKAAKLEEERAMKEELTLCKLKAAYEERKRQEEQELQMLNEACLKEREDAEMRRYEVQRLERERKDEMTRRKIREDCQKKMIEDAERARIESIEKQLEEEEMRDKAKKDKIFGTNSECLSENKKQKQVESCSNGDDDDNKKVKNCKPKADSACKKKGCSSKAGSSGQGGGHSQAIATLKVAMEDFVVKAVKKVPDIVDVIKTESLRQFENMNKDYSQQCEKKEEDENECKPKDCTSSHSSTFNDYASSSITVFPRTSSAQPINIFSRIIKKADSAMSLLNAHMYSQDILNRIQSTTNTSVFSRIWSMFYERNHDKDLSKPVSASRLSEDVRNTNSDDKYEDALD